uniref:ZP domain-containing protein n=1 Tax=Plectus sambesii TaxID=2011161 RepID=A0A914VV38_9BILA
MVTGYNNTVNQTSIACNRTTVTFSLDSDSYLVKEFFYNCIPLHNKPLCGSFGKIYVQNYLNNNSELYSLDHQAPDYYPINVDFHRYNLTAQSIGSNGYEEAEMIQVPIVAVPYAPNRTVDFFDGPAVLLWNSSFPFFVNCLWTSQVYDNSSPLGVGPGGNGGGQTGTVPGDRAVAITMAPRDGGGSGMVYQGDAVRVTIDLTDTEHFAAELPQQCTIGCEEQNYNNDYARCPNVPLEAPSLALGIHSMKVSSQSYYFDFNAFTLDGTGTNLTIDCWIQICVDPAACQNVIKHKLEDS